MRHAPAVARDIRSPTANLTFQWQREMKDKFRESFDVMRGEVLRTQYGQNPWQEHSQVVTSVSWISRVEDPKESLLRSTWDLIIVDEAHKMSEDKKTLAFQLGEALSQRTDHFLMMTATPHKGDPENFRLSLSLLDRDVYRVVRRLEGEPHGDREISIPWRRPSCGRVRPPNVQRLLRRPQVRLIGP